MLLSKASYNKYICQNEDKQHYIAVVTVCSITSLQGILTGIYLPYTCSLSPSASLSVGAPGARWTGGLPGKEEWPSLGPRPAPLSHRSSPGNTSGTDDGSVLEQILINDHNDSWSSWSSYWTLAYYMHNHGRRHCSPRAPPPHFLHMHGW